MSQFRPLPASLREVRGQTQRLRVGHQRNSSADQRGGYGDARCMPELSGPTCSGTPAPYQDGMSSAEKMQAAHSRTRE
jgi:hypothetical protein